MAAVLGSLCGTDTAAAQSYRELSLVRSRPLFYRSFLEIEAALALSFADPENAAIGKEDEDGLDGHVWYHTDDFTTRQALLDAYAGRDGAIVSIRDGEGTGGPSNRLQVAGRYYPFYREGFYQGDDFVPTGRYEGKDWSVFLGIGDSPSQDLFVELGPFFRRYTFDENRDTAANYIVPDDYIAYGARVTAEHDTLALDRRTGKPRSGFLFTLMVEREQNESDRLFGVIGGFRSELPSGLWRGAGRLEWYFPTEAATVEALVEGVLRDEEDRVSNYDAQQPALGHFWVDGTLGLRFDLGGFEVTPALKGQYVRVLEEDGVGSDEEVFFGGGLELRYDFGDAFALFADWSYLDNPSRPPVSATRDTFGEHQVFVGGVLRLGAARF